MDEKEKIAAFLAGTSFAVAGASRDRSKFGNKVLRCYQQHGLEVFPLNPREDRIEGLPCVKDIAALPDRVHGLSIITPPSVTEGLVEEATRAGIRHVWMQPGAESPLAVQRARELGLNVIANGPCLLVVIGFRE